MNFFVLVCSYIDLLNIYWKPYEKSYSYLKSNPCHFFYVNREFFCKISYRLKIRQWFFVQTFSAKISLNSKNNVIAKNFELLKTNRQQFCNNQIHDVNLTPNLTIHRYSIAVPQLLLSKFPFKLSFKRKDCIFKNQKNQLNFCQSSFDFTK